MRSHWRSLALVGASLFGASTSACVLEDPFDFGAPRSCELPDQNVWIYGLMQHAYLWSDDLPAIDPLDYDTPSAMLPELRVGHDRWSRVSDKERTDALFQDGKVVSLGLRTRRDLDDRVVVATVDADSPAALAGLERGDVLRSIGGLTIEQIDQDERWGDIYGESEPGVTVGFVVEDANGEVRELSLTKDWITLETVPLATVLEVEGRPVGYVAFSTFVDTSIAALDSAFAELRRAGVREVVIDLRYNGGGLVVVARHFMHLLVGAIAEGQVAYRVHYNDELGDENDELVLTRVDQSLPALDHVVFITTSSTLSASELVINSVAAHARVSLVGDTTGGKPVGSRHFEFCDQIAVPITFRLVNADDYGDYYEGLPPSCPAPDDLASPLGDPSEASLATALQLLASDECLEHPNASGADASDPAGVRTPPPSPAAPRRAAVSSAAPRTTAPIDAWPELAGLR